MNLNLDTLQAFFGWSTIIHIALMCWASLMLLACGNWVYKIHTKWFPMPRETFNVVIYCFLGFYKLLIWSFALIPWVVLLIINR